MHPWAWRIEQRRCPARPRDRAAPMRALQRACLQRNGPRCACWRHFFTHNLALATFTPCPSTTHVGLPALPLGANMYATLALSVRLNNTAPLGAPSPTPTCCLGVRHIVSGLPQMPCLARPRYLFASKRNLGTRQPAFFAVLVSCVTCNPALVPTHSIPRGGSPWSWQGDSLNL